MQMYMIASLDKIITSTIFLPYQFKSARIVLCWDKNKAALSPLSWFTKTHNRADHIKLPYRHMLMAIVNQKSFKVIIPTWVNHLINVLPCNVPVPINLPSIFHITTPCSTKWGSLECSNYSSLRSGISIDIWR